MAGAVAATLDRIQDRAGIRSRDVAQLLGTTQQTVSRWRHNRADPQPSTLTRLLALEWVATQLAEFYAPDEARLWLYRPHPLLDGQRPADRIQTGDVDAVLALIDQLKSGAYVQVMAVFDPDLLDAIEGLGASGLERLVWRHTFGDYGPEQANTGGARWNPRGVDAIYTSLERDTAITEGAFRLELEPLRPRAKRTVHSLNVALASVVDLRTAAAFAAVGVTAADLKDLGMLRTQLIGGAVEWLGHDGLLVPSARAPGENLIIFPNQMEADGAITRVGAEVIYEPLHPG